MDSIDTLKKKARYAGFLYLLMGVTAPFALLYVPGQLFVAGDAAATAERIRSSEMLLRLGIGAELFHQAVAVWLVLALYQLFKPVHANWARLLVALGALVSVPIMFANAVHWIAAAILAGRPESLAVFSPQQLDTLAYLFMRLHSQGITVASVFWALWLFPFGLLVIRSGFIPRFIGYALIVAGIGYLLGAFVAIVLPDYRGQLGSIPLLLGLGELPVMFWLLIWGARAPKARADTKPIPATIGASGA